MDPGRRKKSFLRGDSSSQGLGGKSGKSKPLPVPSKSKEGKVKDRETSRRRSRSFVGGKAASFLQKKILGHKSGSSLEEGDEKLRAEAAALAAISSGLTLEFRPNRWAFRDKIGSGAFGEVWDAVYKQNNVHFAVKKIRASEDTNLEVQHETEVLKGLSHPNLVAFYGVGLVGKFHWIVMELCSGGSLLGLMQILNVTLDEDQIVCVMKDIVRGVGALHGRGFIHKDIKCGNILISETGISKLSDFGVAQSIQDKSEVTANANGGTLPFLAPEILGENKVCAKSDVWALGMTMIQAAEGKNPYEMLEPLDITSSILTKNPPTLKVPKLWTSSFKDCLAKCLTKDLSKRASLAVIDQHAFLQSKGGDREKHFLPLVKRLIAKKQELSEEAAREARRALVGITRQKSGTNLDSASIVK